MTTNFFQQVDLAAASFDLLTSSDGERYARKAWEQAQSIRDLLFQETRSFDLLEECIEEAKRLWAMVKTQSGQSIEELYLALLSAALPSHGVRIGDIDPQGFVTGGVAGTRMWVTWRYALKQGVSLSTRQGRLLPPSVCLVPGCVEPTGTTEDCRWLCLDHWQEAMPWFRCPWSAGCHATEHADVNHWVTLRGLYRREMRTVQHRILGVARRLAEPPFLLGEEEIQTLLAPPDAIEIERMFTDPEKIAMLAKSLGLRWE